MSRGGFRRAAGAFVLPLEAARLLLKERSLWPVAAIPFLLSVVVLVLALAAVLAHAVELYGFVSSWIPVWSVDHWVEWLWVGPAKGLFHAVAGLLFLVLVAACLLIASLIASLLGAPFHESLSRRVELLVSGRVLESPSESWSSVLGDATRSMFGELRRLLFFLLVQGALAGLGVLIPGAGLFAAPAMTLVTLLFLPLDYASHVLDRRRMFGFRAKRRWVLDHAPSMLGFGAAAFALCLVPGLNLVTMPVLVVGGTLLALRHPPPLMEPQAGPGAAAKMSTSS